MAADIHMAHLKLLSKAFLQVRYIHFLQYFLKYFFSSRSVLTDNEKQVIVNIKY